MANRYPLIIDTADGNKIKELPAGDNLYLRNNSIEEVQDINALGTIDAAAITIAGQPIVAQSFTDLTDVPSNYNNSAGNFLRVNPTADGIIFSEVNDLGNISVDNLTLETGNISPASDNSNQIGLPDKRFWKIHAGSFLGSLRGNDGTLVFDAATNRISYSAVYGAPTALSEFTNDMGFLDSEGIDAAISAALASGSFDTDLVGSVFGDDSTLLVDGVNSRLSTHRLLQVGATDGQALVWSDSNQRWEPGAAVGTGGLEGLTVTQDGARTNVGKNLTEDNNSITSQLYVQPNQIGLQTILNPDGANNTSTGSVNVTNDAVEISISEENLGGNSTVGLLISGTGLELFQSDGVTTSIVTVNGSNVTTSGTITAGNIVADGLEFTGAGVVTVESGSNLILNAANGAGNIVGSGSRITNIADPLDLQDAATKSYVDAVFLGGGVAFFEGDMKGSVFADDSTLLVDGVAGVLKANIEVPSSWTVTTGPATYTFNWSTEFEYANLIIPGSIETPLQSSFVTSNGYGISIDGFNEEKTVDIGNLGGGKFLRITEDVGLGDINLVSLGSTTIKTENIGPSWTFNKTGTLTLPEPVNINFDAPSIRFGGATSVATNNYGFGVPGPAAGVVYTATTLDLASMKLLITIEGQEDGGDVLNHTQVCEMLVVRRTGLTVNTVDSIVYGVVHTSTSPLAIITAEEGVGGRVEIRAQPTNSTPIYVKVHATEVVRGD